MCLTFFFLYHTSFNVTKDIVWVEYLTKVCNLIPDLHTQVALYGNRLTYQSSSHQFQSESRFSRWLLPAAKLGNYSSSKQNRPGGFMMNACPLINGLKWSRCISTNHHPTSVKSNLFWQPLLWSLNTNSPTCIFNSCLLAFHSAF